jgi:hypothetical protein
MPGSDMRSIGGAELAVVQRCRCATWENVMGKSAKIGAVKRTSRPISAGNAKTGERKPPQTAKSTSPPGANAVAGTVRTNSKLGKMIALLQRQDGATIAQMMKATGWQAHSVRGAMSGTIKTRLGLTITSDTQGTDRTYRIVNGKG